MTTTGMQAFADAQDDEITKLRARLAERDKLVEAAYREGYEDGHAQAEIEFNPWLADGDDLADPNEREMNRDWLSSDARKALEGNRG